MRGSGDWEQMGGRREEEEGASRSPLTAPGPLLALSLPLPSVSAAAASRRSRHSTAALHSREGRSMREGERW